MTRKDYVAIAAALKAVREQATIPSWQSCCECIAATMAADNPRFDRARFLKACGVQS